MRVIALLATYNEERFIAGCLEHLFAQGVDAYLIDNCSTDHTVAIAEHYLGSGLIAIESLARAGSFSLRTQLQRKEQLASMLSADWFMHVDADEIHVAHDPRRTLADAFAEVDGLGYNVVNFQEFTFIPTRESEDHDHPDFRSTMRWYYPFGVSSPRYMRAWKSQPASVHLVESGGHVLDFAGMRVYPRQFILRHYMCLSREHAIRKYAARSFDPSEVRDGWHDWRAMLTAEMIEFPPEAELRTYESDDRLDPSRPRARHYLDALCDAARQPV